jgi:hypothetical protein
MRAIWHLDEFVAGNARTVRRRVHLFPADLTVRRMVMGDGFVVRNFIQRPAVGALKCLSHLTNIPWLRSRLLDGPGRKQRTTSNRDAVALAHEAPFATPCLAKYS